ncbi:MAG TPA: response regulator [Gemmatimonadaceae bacterium]|nr:response regulator [Gemmatimonadaceae bacterium]
MKQRLKVDDNPMTAAPAHSDSGGALIGAPSTPVRVLHLEDNPQDAELIHDRLEVAGLASDILWVNNRRKFEDALVRTSYEVILCDFNLPDYDGISALGLAREKQPDVPVIVISGSLNEEEAVRCLHLGATDYLLKQRLERLPNAVRRAILAADELRKRRKTEAELRASEERFRLLAHHSRDGFWFVGLQPQVVLFVSPAVEVIWGRTAREFYADADTFWNAIDPADRHRVRAAWDACADGHVPRFEEEFRVIHSDGSVRLVVNAGTTVFDAANGTAHMSGLVRDITERTQLELELRQAQKMEGIGQLAGGIAHDFNNLLTIIQGNSDLALDELDPGSPSHADICEIKRAAMSAAALTKQLLAFGRRQVLQPRAIELRTVTLDVQNMLGRLIGDNIELVLSLDEPAGCVLADPGQIEQVIINLVVNARDAMPEGGRIAISTATVVHRTQDASSAVCERLTVSDNGVGMDRATRDRIFEPFFTTKPLGHGTGLGLSTVHGIVKQSGGELEVDTAPGRGTSFAIYFPQVSTDSADVPAPVAHQSLTGSETILVVEDQPALRDLVRRVLEQKGYRVLDAQNGEQAVHVAERSMRPIHLVISDVVMPGMNARDMTARIRSTWPAARVLYMSGYHDDDVMLQSLAMAKVDFLQKPFLPYDLAEKAREILERA